MITRLGIIGGVGPLAAAHFYRRLIQRTPVADDAAHLPVVLASEQIPSRIAHLCGTGPSPVPALVRAARILVDAGADAIVIPSATTHAYRDDVLAAVDVPVLDLYAEVDRRLADLGVRRPVLLATSPTAALRLYEAKFSSPVRPIYPAPAAQREVDALIGGVKSGAPLGPLAARLAELLAAAPWPPGADCVVLACTELPVIAPPADPAAWPVFDPAWPASGPARGSGADPTAPPPVGAAARPVVQPAGRPLVDVTDVLADAVLRRWMAGSASCAA